MSSVLLPYKLQTCTPFLQPLHSGVVFKYPSTSRTFGKTSSMFAWYLKPKTNYKKIQPITYIISYTVFKSILTRTILVHKCLHCKTL